MNRDQKLKQDAAKPMYELLPFDALHEVTLVLTYGADKYQRRGWEVGMDWDRLIGGALRHLTAFAKGQDLDPETGYSHLAHLACCVLFLLAYQLRGIGNDDRVKTEI